MAIRFFGVNVEMEIELARPLNPEVRKELEMEEREKMERRDKFQRRHDCRWRNTPYLRDDN